MLEETTMTFEKVAALIAENRDLDASELTMETTFESLGFDSLDTVELVMTFEEEFGVTLEVDENLKTIGDVVRLIDSMPQE